MRYSETRKLLGTEIEIAVISEDPLTDGRIAAVFDFFVSVEAEFSRFREDSALSLLNAHKKATVSKRFLELLSVSKNMYRLTDGFFNPLVSVAKLGYGHSFEEGNFVTVNGSVNTDFHAVKTEGDTVTLEPGQSLDFGGIAKGWAVDRASDMLRMYGYDDFFVNAGGDIYASGTNGSLDRGWVIGIENPFTQEIFTSLVLRDSAIATSWSYKRNWEIGRKKRHHIVNPKTSENENSIVSVTLISPDCAKCDGFTKSVFNAPVSEWLRIIEQNGMEGFIFTSIGELLYTRWLWEKYDLDFPETVAY